MIPGDPARVMAGMNATEADVRLIREKLGLNRPLYIQYLSYIKGTDLDKGDSFVM